jgi:UDP-N-acetylglucosamine diphosphorylase/glucosamine-1-phosphate N-acetyltransferase
MNSDTPKVLHLFQGVPMLARIIKTARQIQAKNIYVVVGKHEELIKKTLLVHTYITDLCFIKQNVPLGTGDAVKKCLHQSYSQNEYLLILNGDMPLINKEILEKFIKEQGSVNIIVAKMENPKGYGRIVYNENSEFTEIVEEKDCNEEQKTIKTINTGIYSVNSNLLKKYIPMIENKNSQKEYYLTDIVKIIKENEKINVNTHIINESENKYVSGVNTQEELKALELN